MSSTPKVKRKPQRPGAALPGLKPKTAMITSPYPPAGARELSVMAWIEDPFGRVLLVKQSTGKKAWTFPGGKVRAHETLMKALRRELMEEIGVVVDVASPVDIFDRAEKGNLTILFRVILKPQSGPIKQDSEIEKFAFLHSAPVLSTPSLQFFWQRAQKSFDPLTSFFV